MMQVSSPNNGRATDDALPVVAPSRAVLEQDAAAATAAAAAALRKQRMCKAACWVIVTVAVLSSVVVIVAELREHPSTIVVPERFSASFSASAVQAHGEAAPTQYTGTLVKEPDSNGKWLLTGSLEYTVDGRKTQVTLVNNRGFYTYTDVANGTITGTGCLTGDQIPMWQQLEGAVASATKLGASEAVVDHLEGRCAGHQKFVVAWGDFTYVLCILNSGDGDNQYEFVGESWAADLFDIKTGTTMLTVTTPTDAAGAAMQCPELEYPSPPASRRRLGGAASDEEKDLWYLRSTQERAAARRSLATSKPCVFMHGLGHDKNGNSKSSFKDYWGDVHKWAECGSYTFIERDTKNVAFNDPALLSHFCSEAGGGTITNTIIFTHSMGSLIAAAALHSNTCSFGAGTKWFQVEGPLAGAKAADVATNMCNKGAVKWLAKALGFCSGASIQSLKTSYTDFSKYASVVQNNVDGAMCGRSAWGLTSKYSVPVSAAAGIVGFSGASDGIVGWSSCDYNMPSGFGSHYNDAFYKPDVNHLDGTCRNGNGWVPWWGGGDDRQPCRWFKARTN